MILKVKKLSKHAILPAAQTSGANGFDLVATTKEFDESTGILTYGTGIAVELPKGHAGLLMPRSSVYKTGMYLCNSIGLLDEDYRGEIKFKFYRGSQQRGLYEIGDRIGQLVVIPVPKLEIVESQELSSTIRDENGYGSTGK